MLRLLARVALVALQQAPNYSDAVTETFLRGAGYIIMMMGRVLAAMARLLPACTCSGLPAFCWWARGRLAPRGRDVRAVVAAAGAR